MMDDRSSDQTARNIVCCGCNDWSRCSKYSFFNDILNFDGVILTKLDGDTRGGAALSIKSLLINQLNL
jgi:signal recognition particle GTPase